MSNVALAIIDGTGSWENSEYEQDMANSFCKQLHKKISGKVQYERGPSFEGQMTTAKGRRAAEFLKIQKNCLLNPKIILAGYS
jgi:hypothetical protein